MPIDADLARNGRVSFLGVEFDPFSLGEIASRLRAADPGAPFAYLVTPNVDHMVRLDKAHGREERELRLAYANAAYCVCDSRILAALARRHGVTLPVAPGSDLTALLFREVIGDGDTIALIGGDERHLPALRDLKPGVRFVQHVPPMGLRRNPAALDAAARFAAEAGARFTFLAVGSPQQELVATRISTIEGAVGTGLCVGAAVDFVLGFDKRAPRLVQRLHLEWLHRLLSNPSKMWRRYLVDGPRIFRMASAWGAARSRKD